MKNYFFFKIFILFLFFSSTVKAQNELENYTFKLTQSTAEFDFWTSNPCERIFKDAVVPSQTGSEIKFYAARNEFEPFLLIVKPKSSENVTVNIGDFGSGITSQVYQVKYVNITQVSDNLGRLGDYPDPLFPIEKNSSISIIANENTAFWFDVSIPKTTASGDYTTNVTINGVSIPVKLHVFNFAISDELHIKSQMNFSVKTILQKYSVTGTGDDYWKYVDMVKQFFIDHRLTPKSVMWPSGLTSSGGACFINYNCDNHTLSDPHGIWGFEHPANKYLNGNGFNNGTGFPSAMMMTFQNNDASQDQRPSEFCGVTRGSGDWYTANNTNSSYNQKWFTYITALQDYLSNLGYLDEAYYYFANEPQDQDDYDAVAWYSKHLKQAAPNLKLMVSEEAKPEIYNTGKIDIWLPVLNKYEPTAAHDRQLNHGEETWVYFLHGTRPPYFNPITLDHQGIESKYTGWFLWKYRLKGIAYYSLNNWSKNPWTDPLTDGHNGDLFMFYPPSENNQNITYSSNNHRLVPSIRFELMRDGLEDYEYFYKLNNNSQPVPNQTNTADTQVDKIISSLTSYTRNSQFMYNLRRVVGLYLGGEISEIPNLEIPSTGTPKNCFINFQDVNGEPTASPLVVNDIEYQKIGVDAYSEETGHGWIGATEHFVSSYDPWGDETNELKRSCVCDNYAHNPNTFQYDIPNGTYEVEVCVGAPRKKTDHNYISIEGNVFIDDEVANTYIIRKQEVEVKDNNLTVEVGIWDEYTYLCYLNVDAKGVSIKDRKNQLAKDFKISPNPVKDKTTFYFNLEKTANVEIEIFDLTGKKIKIIPSKKYNAGSQNIFWNGKDSNNKSLVDGVYFCVLKINGEKVETLRCVFSR